MKTSLFQSAADNWPEDEAHLQADFWRGLCEDYPEDGADNEARLRKDVTRMETFFAREPDAADLTRRFRAKLTELTGLTF